MARLVLVVFLGIIAFGLIQIAASLNSRPKPEPVVVQMPPDNSDELAKEILAGTREILVETQGGSVLSSLLITVAFMVALMLGAFYFMYHTTQPQEIHIVHLIGESEDVGGKGAIIPYGAPRGNERVQIIKRG